MFRYDALIIIFLILIRKKIQRRLKKWKRDAHHAILDWQLAQTTREQINVVHALIINYIFEIL
jgi:hypothetical protein